MALGPSDYLQCVQQYEHGHGDYTAERQSWVDDLDFDTIVEKIRELCRRESSSDQVQPMDEDHGGSSM